MAKVRSLFAIGCRIAAAYPFRHGFTLLRVLALDNCKATEGSRFSRFVFRLEHMKHLLHLRFLSIRGASVERIPEEIGCLRFLQTLDLEGCSSLKEFPSPGSLPEQLVRLCLPISSTETIKHSNSGIFSLARLTSLEELSISVSEQACQHLPTELRVLRIRICRGSASTERDCWECVRHLNKLQHLRFLGGANMLGGPDDDMHVLPNKNFRFYKKVPSSSGVNASCLANLSHLYLRLEHMDEHDLKTLGMLPELRFLGLAFWTLATVISAVVVISEMDDAAVVYFPKLWCCELTNVMVSFHANDEEHKSISSFHVWGGGRLGYDDSAPSVSEDKPTISCSTGGGGGGGGGSATRGGGGGAPRDRFMPCLQVLRFELEFFAIWDHRLCDNLGFEYGLPSLQEIVVDAALSDKITAALLSAAEAHPNRPAFRVETM